MSKRNSLVFGLAAGIVFLLTATAPGRAEVHTFFAGTQYALDVHFLRGEKPGPTIFVQGGIQGDESAGFLTAQLLTRAKVTKGTVIVVPRANPPSINEQARAINVDLNRRFDKDYNEFYEDRLARLIRFLVDQSQALVHLHEGSGFYSPKPVNALRGPNRYGQSIIIDTTDRKRASHLERPVRQVLAKLNENISPAQFKFELFNMDTFNDRSHYLEQRKSLTYYAVSNLGIPAVAVEVSKNIPDLAWKVNHQLKATVLFLRQFGVELEAPDMKAADVKAYPSKDIVVRVNGAVLDKTTPKLTVAPGAPLDVRCEGSGAEGLSPVTAVFASDRPGFNLAKAPRMPLAPFTGLDVRADGVVLAKTTVEWTGPWPKSETASVPALVCWLGGTLQVVPEGGTLTAVQGDQLILEGIKGGKPGEVLNLKGYISRVGKNDGQDAGNEIILDPKSFLPKFFLASQNAEEHLCEVVRETPGAPRSRFFIRLLPREVATLVLTTSQGASVQLAWRPGKPAHLPAGRYTLADIQGNGPAGMVQAFVGKTPLTLGATFQLDEKTEISLRQTTTFAEMGKMAVSSQTLLSLAQ